MIMGWPPRIEGKLRSHRDQPAPRSQTRTVVPVTENSAYPMRRLALPLAPGAVVIAHQLGPDPATFEHGIYIAIPQGNYAIELEIQGGRSLTWADAEPYWKELAPLVSALGR